MPLLAVTREVLTITIDEMVDKEKLNSSMGMIPAGRWEEACDFCGSSLLFPFLWW